MYVYETVQICPFLTETIQDSLRDARFKLNKVHLAEGGFAGEHSIFMEHRQMKVF